MATAATGNTGDSRRIGLYRNYCKARGIPTTGVLAMTVQKNRTSNFSSAIIDFENEMILSHYPADELSSYKETSEGSFLVSYLANLDVVTYAQDSAGMSSRGLGTGEGKWVWYCFR